ncbi:hypothetical protein NQ315_004624 [Exocentrus adspersus]|uniref:Uncharacterized protein n=1 Tax=Exocentrus adspersus TaxID=1586481 RepID=A0AAV8VN55_9CUCU|nr:hypothetical protein NQ315_004624 [Exocentrus adspersus]
MISANTLYNGEESENLIGEMEVRLPFNFQPSTGRITTSPSLPKLQTTQNLKLTNLSRRNFNNSTISPLEKFTWLI